MLNTIKLEVCDGEGAGIILALSFFQRSKKMIVWET
jgi:hypothetical protein